MIKFQLDLGWKFQKFRVLNQLRSSTGTLYFLSLEPSWAFSIIWLSMKSFQFVLLKFSVRKRGQSLVWIILLRPLEGAREILSTQKFRGYFDDTELEGRKSDANLRQRRTDITAGDLIKLIAYAKLKIIIYNRLKNNS